MITIDCRVATDAGVTVNEVELSVAEEKMVSPAYWYVIGYGVPDAGIVDTGKAVLNVPLLPIEAVLRTPLIATETDSPEGGKVVPAPIAPVSVMEPDPA